MSHARTLLYSYKHTRTPAPVDQCLRRGESGERKKYPFILGQVVATGGEVLRGTADEEVVAGGEGEGSERYSKKRIGEDEDYR